MDKMTTGDVPCPNCGRWGCSGINCPGRPLAPPYPVFPNPMVYNMTLLPMMTKLELFAAMAMQGYNAQRNPNMGRCDKVCESVADADALLAALEGKGE